MTRRRRKLLLLALLLLLLAGLGFQRLPAWSGALLANGLSSFFHRPCTVGLVRFHLFPIEAEIQDVRIGGYAPPAAPFLEIPLARVTPSLNPLWAGRLVLSRVRLTGLRIRVNAFPDPPEGPGGDDIPKMGGGGGGGLDLRVGRLVIENGEFVLNHDRVPLDLDLPDFRGRLVARKGVTLAGSISFGPGQIQFGSAPALPVGTEFNCHLVGPLLTVDSGHLHAEGIDLGWRGQIRFAARPQGQFRLVGPVDLDRLDRHVMRTGLGIKGAARWDGVLSVDGSRLRIEGRMEGTAGAFQGVPIPRFAGGIQWSGNGVELHGLDLETLGGSGTLEVTVPSGPGTRVAISGPLRGVDGEALVRYLFDLGVLGLGSSATGDFAVSWPKGHTRQISGRVAADLASRPDDRTPLRGRFEWRAERGVQTVERAELVTPHTQARLEGRIEGDDRTDLSVDAESSDLAAADQLLARIRGALGNLEAQPAGFSGRGTFRGRWQGTLQEPLFEGRFSGQEVGYLGVVWGGADWVGSVDPYEVRSHSLVLRRPGGELWLDGQTETGYYGERDALNVRIRLKDWPAPDVVKAMGWRLELTGLLSGEAAVQGRRSAPSGSSRIVAAQGRYYRIPYADLEVEARWRGSLAEVTSGFARIGGGTVRFRGSLTDDGVYDGSAEADNVELEDVVPSFGSPLRGGGRVSGNALLQGTLARPRLRASLRSPRLFVGDEGLGALEATLSGSGDGRIALAADCRSPRVELHLEGGVAATSPYQADLAVRARDTSLDPFLRLVAPSLPPAVGIVATGEAQLRGPLLTPRGLDLAATASALEIHLPEYPIRNREPLRVAVAGGRLELGAVHLAGEGTDLRLEGGVALAADGPLALSLRGTADLRALSAITRRLRGRGAAVLAMTARGTSGAPQVEGTLRLEGAGVRVRDFPHGLDDVHGSVRFTESGAELEGLTGTLAGGPVEVSGQAAYGEGRLKSFDFHAGGHDMALRYPEGLRSLVDADLRLFGDGSRQWLAGMVDVKQAVWTKRYDVASELLGAGEAFAGPSTLGDSLRYDLKVHAPGTLRIDNNLATLQARAELAVQGTADAPAVLGRAEIDRGRVYFQGTTYIIRRGTIDFVNPQKIDPLFDVEAETRIRSYRVTLKVNGTIERITPTLTSDPPLTALQILSLLAGAEESAVTSLTQAQTEQQRLAGQGAATLAAGKLSEEMGLERGAEKVFGLNRFSIDPLLLRGSATNSPPTARLTVGKRLTPDLTVFYSTDLGGAQERIVSVEYTLSDRLSLLLTLSEPGGLGFDLRLRQAR